MYIPLWCSDAVDECVDVREDGYCRHLLRRLVPHYGGLREGAGRERGGRRVAVSSSFTTHLENHLEVFSVLCTEHLHIQVQVEAVMYVAGILVFDEDRGGQRTATGLRGTQFLNLAMWYIVILYMHVHVHFTASSLVYS